MNEEQVGRILAKAAAFDNRNSSSAAIEAWGDVIGDLNFNWCLDAVTAYYSEPGNRWILPADVKAIVDARMARAAEIARRLEPPAKLVYEGAEAERSWFQKAAEIAGNLIRGRHDPSPSEVRAQADHEFDIDRGHPSTLGVATAARNLASSVNRLKAGQPNLGTAGGKELEA